MESSSINSMTLCNVAFTRNKEMLKVYSTKGEYNQVKEQYCRQDAKELLTDIGRQYGIDPHAQVQQQTTNQADSQAQQVAYAVAPQQAPEQQKGFLTTAKEKLLGLFKKAPEPQQQNGLQSIKDAMEHGSKVAPQQVVQQPAQEPQKQPAKAQDIPDAIKAQIARQNQLAQQAQKQAQAELVKQQAERARQAEIAKQQEAQRKKEQAVQAVKHSKKQQKSRGPSLSI